MIRYVWNLRWISISGVTIVERRGATHILSPCDNGEPFPFRFAINTPLLQDLQRNHLRETLRSAHASNSWTETHVAGKSLAALDSREREREREQSIPIIHPPSSIPPSAIPLRLCTAHGHIITPRLPPFREYDLLLIHYEGPCTM